MAPYHAMTTGRPASRGTGCAKTTVSSPLSLRCATLESTTLAGSGTSNEYRRAKGCVAELRKASSGHSCMALSNWLMEILSLV